MSTGLSRRLLCIQALAFASRSSPPSPEYSSIHSLLHDLLGLLSRAILVNGGGEEEGGGEDKSVAGSW